MDETEVQVEIACWAQDHPEASTINNWENGNEPWVDFSGKRCTLHVGLGGLTWNIEVPFGYQTEVDPLDGRRKRVWEPFEYQDTVIIQSKSTPFHVSVVDYRNSVMDLSSEKARSGQAEAQQTVHDMLKNLRLQEEERDIKCQPITQYRTEISPIISNACSIALHKAETLAEVLDAIHGLAKLCKVHWSPKDGAGSCSDAHLNHASMDDISEDEMDDLFTTSTMIPIKWSWIRAQVDCAGDACDYEARAASYARDCSEEDSCVLQVGRKLETPNIASPSLPTGSLRSDTEAEYTLISPRPPTELDGVTREQMEHDCTVRDTSGFRTCDSDSEDSDSSWEIPNISDEEICSMCEPQDLNHDLDVEQAETTGMFCQDRLQLKLPRISSFPESKLTSPSGESWQPDDQRSLTRESMKELQWCSIVFNHESFSVECTLRLSEFMDSHVAAAALGLSLEHPLRVEIVPNKAEVDALSWTGAVEVYVSQHTDWHHHISEEICGLLCLVPYIVQNYFHIQVPNVLRHEFTKEPKGDLFIGVLQTLVKRLINLNIGGTCCVCAKSSERPSYLYMEGRRMWPCSDNLCRTMFATWEKLSSIDVVEREREEYSGLDFMEQTIMDDFPYDERDALKAALDAYRVNTHGMRYRQMIRALARIELWNQKDPYTPDADTLFIF